jgi:hypothetical protein
MNFDPKIIASIGSSIESLEKILGNRLPVDYPLLAQTCAVGRVTIGPFWVVRPDKVEAETESFRARIAKHWFWNETKRANKKTCLKCVVLCGSMDGDDIVFYPPERVFHILPRDGEDIIILETAVIFDVFDQIAFGQLLGPSDEGVLLAEQRAAPANPKV